MNAREQSSFEQAAGWLRRCADGHGLTVSGRLRILVGLHICARVVPEGKLALWLAQQLRTTGGYLNALEFKGNTRALSLDDPFLLLLALHIFRTHGHRVGIFEHCASTLAASMARLTSLPLSCRGLVMLLAQLGYSRPQAHVILDDELAGREGYGLLALPMAQTMSVCSNVAVATRFGCLHLRGGREAREYLREVVPILMFAALRSYDLGSGAVFLRTACYTGICASKAVRLAKSFLIAQQTGDGMFGYLHAESVEMRKAQSGRKFNATTDLYLPITLACLWALAESIVPQFRLFAFSPTGSPRK